MAYRPSGIASVSGLASDPATQAKMAAANSQYNDYVQSQKDAARNNFLKTAAIGAGSFALGPVLGGLGAVGGAASGPATGVGGAVISKAPLMSAPAAAGSRFSLNSLLTLGQLGANLFGSITGQHSQTKATDLARQEQQREFDQQQQMLAQQMAADKAEKDRVFAEQQKQWEAQQQMAATQWAAQEQDRQRRQQLEDYNLQLTKDAEARKAPRRALSQQALIRLQDFLHMGR